MTGAEGFTPKIVLQDTFTETLNSLKKRNIEIPRFPEKVENDSDYYSGLGRVKKLEDRESYKIDVKAGEKYYFGTKRPIMAYDESILRYSTLEGSAICTAHALCFSNSECYSAMSYITLNFYTKSDDVAKLPGLKLIKKDEAGAAVDKMEDEISLFEKYVPKGSLLLIDGPLIAGDAYTRMIAAEKLFISKNVFPIFFVKNSSSNLVTDYYEDYRGKYNSDMHWASNILKTGERTSFFEYIDQHNNSNAKIFCYIKFYDGSSPVRVEFFKNMFFEHRNEIEDYVNFILYLIYCQGDLKNPQARPIAIAEKYARATMAYVDVPNLVKKTGLTPTMNEKRGMVDSDGMDCDRRN